MTHQQETQPKLGSRDCLTVGAASAMMILRGNIEGEYTPSTFMVQVHHIGATPMPSIALRGRLGYGRVTSALPKKANWIGGLPLHSIEPFDAGAGQNRSSGHEGEGPPARKAKGYGQWRWVGQRAENRIGVPKASNDFLLTIRIEFWLANQDKRSSWSNEYKP